jgi:8-oxo-dGTP pyrophosphatase MutT (NUDIX family)
MAPKATTSKSDGRVEKRDETSAGGLIWRRDPAGQFEFVLIRPSGKNFWALPKGHVEPGESVAEAAVREVREETGLTVANLEPLGQISYIYSFRENPAVPLVRIFKRVHFFLMEMQGGDTARHDAEIDQVAWLGFDDAVRRVTFENERKLIVKGGAMLSAGVRQTQGAV